MQKKRLIDYFNEKRRLNNYLIVSHPLIPKMEILGYVEADVSDELGFDFICLTHDHYRICSDRLICTVDKTYYKNNDCKRIEYKQDEHSVMPIFSSISIEDREHCYPFSNLYLQCFSDQPYYNEARKNDNRIYDLRNKCSNHLKNRLNFEEGKGLFITKPGDIICYDHDGEVRGACSKICVICRYLSENLGLLQSDIFPLDSLYIES